MPWCDDCNKYFKTPALTPAGECPACNKVIAKPRPKAPWHFKLLIVGTSGYLVYRLVWFIQWLPHHT